MSHASLPYPVKHARYTIPVPYLDADGDPTDPTTPDTESSQDGGAFADCTEEVTTISGSNGVGYLTLTGAETNCSLLVVCAKVASGPKATLLIDKPRVLPILLTGTASAGGNTSITLAAGAYDLTGCIVRTTGGTGGGGTGGANNQARVITAYDTSAKVATVEPAWETNPDNTTTYDILLTELACNTPVTRGLRPTTDGRTLVVDANGLADANTVKIGPTGSGTAQTAANLAALIGAFTGTGVNTVLGLLKAIMSKIASTPSDVGGTFDPSTDSLEAIREKLDLSSSTAGAGAITTVITINNVNTGLPLAGAAVWVSTDSAGSNVVAGTLYTNASGQVTFFLDAGVVYVWVQDDGYNGTNPTALTVS